jgi:hypothetical protein
MEQGLPMPFKCLKPVWSEGIAHQNVAEAGSFARPSLGQGGKKRCKCTMFLLKRRIGIHFIAKSGK